MNPSSVFPVQKSFTACNVLTYKLPPSISTCNVWITLSHNGHLPPWPRTYILVY